MQKELKTILMIMKKYLKVMLMALPIAILLLAIGMILVVSNSSALPQPFEFIVTLANILIAIVAVTTLRLTLRSNERAQKLFVGQNMPQIDITPTKVVQGSKGTHVALFVSVANYSGFVAYDICIDMKYGDNDWIGEWIRADSEKNQKPSSSTVIPDKPYDLGLAFSLGKLLPGHHYEFPEEGVSGQLVFSGSLNLEEEVCSKGKDGFPISIRARWNNEEGHTFEKISEYKLICTKMENGRAFTMVPIIGNNAKKSDFLYQGG